MATINATITINSDIGMGANISKSMNMHKFQSAVGLEETDGLSSKVFNATTAVKIVDNADGTAGKASKVYVRNTGSSKDNFFYVAFNASAAGATTTETIGKLYGGDWMLIPWAATAATTHDIFVAPNTAEEMNLEWMVFVE